MKKQPVKYKDKTIGYLVDKPIKVSFSEEMKHTWSKKDMDTIAKAISEQMKSKNRREIKCKGCGISITGIPPLPEYCIECSDRLGLDLYE